MGAIEFKINGTTLNYDNRDKLGIEILKGDNIPSNLAPDQFFKWKESSSSLINMSSTDNSFFENNHILNFNTGGTQYESWVGYYSNKRKIYFNNNSIHAVTKSVSPEYFAWTSLKHSINNIIVNKTYKITGSYILRYGFVNNTFANRDDNYVFSISRKGAFEDNKIVKSFSIEITAISDDYYDNTIWKSKPSDPNIYSENIIAKEDVIAGLGHYVYEVRSSFGLFYMWLTPSEIKIFDRGVRSIQDNYNNGSDTFFIDEIVIDSIKEKRYVPNKNDGLLDIGLYNPDPSKNCRLVPIPSTCIDLLKDDYFNEMLKITENEITEKQKYAKRGYAPIGKSLYTLDPGTYTFRRKLVIDNKTQTSYHDTYITNSNGIRVVTLSDKNNVRNIFTIKMCAGGGGGGHGSGGYGGAGAGGGGGASAIIALDISNWNPLYEFDLFVGTGGAGGPSGDANGKTGGFTEIRNKTEDYHIIRCGGGGGGGYGYYNWGTKHGDGGIGGMVDEDVSQFKYTGISAVLLYEANGTDGTNGGEGKANDITSKTITGYSIISDKKITVGASGGKDSGNGAGGGGGASAFGNGANSGNNGGTGAGGAGGNNGGFNGHGGYAGGNGFMEFIY